MKLLAEMNANMLSRKGSEKRRSPFRNEAGAIDLASIMVGIIVIGLTGSVVAATVFTVIPWTQNNAAKQQLDSVVSAQSAYRGLSSGVPPVIPDTHEANSFATTQQLEEAGLLANGDSYCTLPSEDGLSYEAFSRSSSNEFWTVSSENTKPVQIDPADIPIECADIDNPMLTTLTYQCDTAQTVMLPIRDGVGTATWSDGTSSSHTGTEPITKALQAGKTYQVTFDGTYTTFGSKNGDTYIEGTKCLTSLDHWGSKVGVTNANGAFFEASKLVDVPKRVPLTITNMGSMFDRATNFNDADVSHWKTSNSTVFSRTFRQTFRFNQDLSGWDLSKATTTSGMFETALAFNQPIGMWDVSKVGAMNGMFHHAESFNQPLNGWNTSQVRNMEQMFVKAVKFNQPLDNWDVSKVHNMDAMFDRAASFSQDLSGWNTASVTTATKFSQNSGLQAHQLPPRVQ